MEPPESLALALGSTIASSPAPLVSVSPENSEAVLPAAGSPLSAEGCWIRYVSTRCWMKLGFCRSATRSLVQDGGLLVETQLLGILQRRPSPVTAAASRLAFDWTAATDFSDDASRVNPKALA